MPSDFKLPPLHTVYEDAALLLEMKMLAPPRNRAVLFVDGSASTLNADGDLPEPIAWNTSLPSLFEFAYFTHIKDAVIFALVMFLRVFTESTESQLRAMGHILAHQKAEDALYFVTTNTRVKLANHLLNPRIDRPEEALTHLRASILQDAGRMKEKSETDRYKANPLLYIIHCDALVFSNQFNIETRKELDKCLDAARTMNLKKKFDFSFSILILRSHLALVLEQLDVDKAEQKEHTEYCAKYLRKNPKVIPDRILSQILFRQNQPPHPVLTALGGLSWLKGIITREGLTARMEDRKTMSCRNCGVREPQKILFRCSGCKYIYYCSKECQKANWRVHKASAEAKKKAEELKAEDPKAAQKAKDLIKFRESSTSTNSLMLAHALGIHKDPSRGRTHIVFREVEYRPKQSKDFRFRFHAIGMGVFRINDVLKEIEAYMGLDSGTGETYIQEMLEDLDAAHSRWEKVPILDLTWGEGIQAWLGFIAISKDALRRTPYNPRWREAINFNGEPPEPLVLRSGAKDVENALPR